MQRITFDLRILNLDLSLRVLPPVYYQLASDWVNLHHDNISSLESAWLTPHILGAIYVAIILYQIGTLISVLERVLRDGLSIANTKEHARIHSDYLQVYRFGDDAVIDRRRIQSKVAFPVI